jgi:hypothetical protein
MPSAAATQISGAPAPQEAGLEVVPQNPRISGGFSLPGSAAGLPLEIGRSVIQKGRKILTGGEVDSSEPLYAVEGALEIAGHETRYTLTATESCDSEKGLAVFIPGLIGFKTTSRPLGEANTRIGEEYTLRLGTVRHDGDNPGNNFSNPVLTQAKALGLILEDAKNNKEIRRDLPGGDKIDFEALNMILHSLGGLAGTEFILSNQSKIKEARYLASVGLGSPTLDELFEDNANFGGAIDLAEDVLSVFRNIYQREGVRGVYKSAGKILHYHQRPERVIAEIISCVTTNIEEGVQQVEADTSLQEYELDTLVRPDYRRAKLVGEYSLIPGLRHCAPQHSSETVAEEMHDPKHAGSGLEVLPQAA